MPLIPLPVRTNPLPDLPAPVLDRERRPQVDNRGVIAAAGALGAAAKMPLVDGDALAAPYAALGAVGEAIARTGSVMAALAEKRAEAESDVQVASFDADAEKASAEHEAWRLETNASPRLWDADMSARLDKLRQTYVEREDLQPSAREQINLRMTRFDGQARARVLTDSAKATFGEARSAFLATLDSATEAQDLPRHEEALATSEAKGYLYAHEAEAARQQFKHVGERKRKEREAEIERQKYDEVRADAALYPQKWLHDNPQPWRGEEALWMFGKNIADARLSEGTAAAVREVQNGIAVGQLTTPKDIEAIDDDFLTPALREEAKQQLAQRDALAERRDREENGVRNAVELRRRVLDYEPAKDPERTQYFSLVREIGTRVEQSMAGELTGELYRRYGGNPPKLAIRPEIQRNVSRTLDRMFDAETGAIPWRKQTSVRDAKGREVKDANDNVKMDTIQDDAARQQAINAQALIERHMIRWFQENPTKAGDVNEIQKEMNRALPEGMRGAVLMNSLQKFMPPQRVSRPVDRGIEGPLPELDMDDTFASDRALFP